MVAAGQPTLQPRLRGWGGAEHRPAPAHAPHPRHPCAELPQCTDYGMLCAKEGSWVFCRGSALLATKQLATNVASPPVVASGALRRSGPAAAAAASVVAAAGLLLVV